MATVFFGLAYLLIAPSVATAQGDVNNFVIDNFKADYVIDSKKSGGSLETTEVIDLTFSTQNHGILRAIPDNFKGYQTKLKIQSVELNGASEQYTTSKQNGNLVLKIGNPDETITGKNTYTIRYYQERIIDFSDQAPVFNWNVNGTQWGQPFTSIQATVRYASGNIDSTKAQCFTGLAGSTSQNCQVAKDSVNQVSSTANGIQPNENLTINVPLTGDFKQPGTTQKLLDNLDGIVGIVAGLLIAFGAGLVWLRRGKDYVGKGVIVPEYDPPKQLTPGEVGMLADYHVDNRDITATLIDLAVRRYYKIHEESKKSWLVTKRLYSLELLNSDFKMLKDHEKSLVQALFPTPVVGTFVKLDELDKSAMQSAVSDIKGQVQARLMDNYGLIDKDAHGLNNLFNVASIGLAIIGFILFFIFGHFGIIIGIVIASGAFIVFGNFMPRRTHAGVEVYEKIMGLKLFMNTAEKERLAMLQSVERPYAEPSKTVDLFEKLLPFAIALGVEKSWAKQFDGILTQTPDWYSTTNAFTAGYIASSIGDASNNFGSNFVSNSSVSSDGGGGSGFSGGGGGGGGGGGW